MRATRLCGTRLSVCQPFMRLATSLRRRNHLIGGIVGCFLPLQYHRGDLTKHLKVLRASLEPRHSVRPSIAPPIRSRSSWKRLSTLSAWSRVAQSRCSGQHASYRSGQTSALQLDAFNTKCLHQMLASGGRRARAGQATWRLKDSFWRDRIPGIGDKKTCGGSRLILDVCVGASAI